MPRVMFVVMKESNVIASAFGEVSTAIGMIADMLYPMRNNHEYSSLRRGE